MTEALASINDVQALANDSTLSSGQLSAMLASASARFRKESNNDFTATDFAGVLKARDGIIRLKSPVVEITSVESVLTDGTAGVPLTYTFDGIDEVRIASDVVEAIIYPDSPTSAAYVTYTHGYTEIPEDVRWAVAAMVQRAVAGPNPGVTGETIGGYSWQAGGYTASGALSMTRDELSLARSYRDRSAVVPT